MKINQQHQGLQNCYLALFLRIGLAGLAANSAAATRVMAWGDNTYGQTNVPGGLTNVTMVAQGGMHGLALKGDTTVTAWGYNYNATTPLTYEGQATPPPGLSNVVQVAAGYNSSLALINNGTVVFWGDTAETNLPVGTTNMVAVAAGSGESMALRSDGVVFAWGSNSYGQTNVPNGLTNVIAIASGGVENAVLLSNRTVVVWGWNGYGQTNPPPFATNVVAIACGLYHVMALRGDGTVVVWGYNGYGQTNVPAGLTNVVQIAAGAHHCLALKRDGRVTAWGYNSSGQGTVPAAVSNVVAISASRYQSLALVNDGTPWILKQPQNQTVYSGMNGNLSVQAIGGTNFSFQWQFNGSNISGATNTALTLTNAQTTNSGNYAVVITSVFGSVTSIPAGLTVLDSPHHHHRIGDAVARTTRDENLAAAAQTTGAAGRPDFGRARLRPVFQDRGRTALRRGEPRV